MDPNHVIFFRSILAQDAAKISEFMKSNPHAAWYVNKDNQSAFDYALEINNVDCINVMLKELYQDTQSDKAPQQATWIFHHALNKAVRHFCSDFKEWKDYTEFFNHPETSFTLLKQSTKYWGSYVKDLIVKPGAASAAYSEAINIKPTIQRMIRTHTISAALYSSLNLLTQPATVETLKSLKNDFMNWSKMPFLQQHTDLFMSYSTSYPKSYTTLLDCLSALQILIDNQGSLPITLTLDQAQKIMILCAKCYAYSPSHQRSLRGHWLELAQKILDIFVVDSSAMQSLFEKILDKQWVFSEEDLPYAEAHLLQGLSLEHIKKGLIAFKLNEAAESLSSSLPLSIYPGPGMDILALYPLPNGKKHIAIGDQLKPESLAYLHRVLMNNSSISITFSSNKIFEEYHLNHFPHAQAKISIDILNDAQLSYLHTHVSTNTRVHAHAAFNLTEKFLTDHRSIPEIQNLQHTLGPKQFLMIQILDSITNRQVLADLIMDKNELGLGACMLSKTAKKPQLFNLLYNKFNWTDASAATTPEAQFNIVSKGLQADKPLMFIFSRQSFEPETFIRIQNLLKKHPSRPCLIRYDHHEHTACDFIVNEKLALPGPLFKAALCKEPSLFASANSVHHTLKIEKEVPVQEPSGHHALVL